MTAAARLAVMPDVTRLKTTAVGITLSGCSDPMLNGITANLTGFFTAAGQTLANPSLFTATMQLGDPVFKFSQVYKLTGRVASVNGQVTSTFTYASSVNGVQISTGIGTIDAQIPGLSLSGALSAHDTSAGDTCQLTGTISIDSLP